MKCSAIALLGLISLVVFSPQAMGQNEWVPNRFLEIALNQIAVAKVAPSQSGEDTLFLAIQPHTSETLMREIEVTTMQTEQRTRNVEVNGETVVQTYTVTVPTVKTAFQSYEVLVPGERVIRQVALDEASFWNVKGQRLETEQIRTRLAKPQRVFLLFSDSDDYQADPFFAPVLNPETLVARLPGQSNWFTSSTP